jgi:hypothetical protein
MRRHGDRIFGILLGLVLGIAIVAVFVFVFSEETVDAPSLDRDSGQQQGER